MKKNVLFAGLLMAACVLAGTLTGCAKKEDSSVFVLGLDDSFPPLGFRDADNKIVGYDIDLAAEACSRLGLTLKCQPINWDSKEQELNTRKISCIWNGLTITEQRRKDMLFTKPYLDNAQVVVVRRDSGITNLDGLRGKVLGLQAGSSAADALAAAGDFEASLGSVIEFDDNITALNDLGIGNIDAVVMDEVVAVYTIRTAALDFVVLEQNLGSEEYGVAFRKGNNALRDKIQKTLEEMQADGTVEKLSQKWFGQNLSVIGRN